eukprot:TRINITY_DN22805_c0_g1_i1.p1 TRINITY_DN22805_c0_g1~~TRINITY_DN22805_c0_g1_i1.p1  ORF type:complete len:340 (-),score=38.20 TRINITY_DN22805_c0_g1_i1:153-1172(-)
MTNNTHSRYGEFDGEHEQANSSPFREFCTNLSPIRITGSFPSDMSPINRRPPSDGFRGTLERDSEMLVPPEQPPAIIHQEEQTPLHQETTTGKAKGPPQTKVEIEEPMEKVESVHRNQLEEPPVTPGKIEEEKLASPRTGERTSTARKNSTSTNLMTCSCKRSRCLKLYCECFANGRMCSRDCKCENCRNDDTHSSERAEAIKLVRGRLPSRSQISLDGFEETKNVITEPIGEIPQLSSEVLKVKRGCNCRRSGCRKRYCECFEAGRMCGPDCNCENCRNKGADGILKGKLIRKLGTKAKKGANTTRARRRGRPKAKFTKKGDTSAPNLENKEEIFLPY